MAAAASQRLGLCPGSLPPGFRRWQVLLPPGSERAYDEAVWRDAIVLVEEGQIELVCLAGRRCRFERGAIVFLAGLPLRAIRNRAREPARLIAVARVSPTPPRINVDFRLAVRRVTRRTDR